MDPFAAPSETDLDLLEEIERLACQNLSAAETAAAADAFQAQSFEAAWSDKEDLSDAEKTLFPEFPEDPDSKMDRIDLDSLFPTSSQDPFLSSTANALDVMLPVSSGPFDGDDVLAPINENNNSMKTAAPHIDDHCYVNTPPASPLLSDDGVDKENEDDSDPDVIMYDDSESDEVTATIKQEEDGDCDKDECFVEPIPEEEKKRVSKPELIARRKKTRRGKKKPKANAWSAQKKALVKEEKVVKLYEQEPFENPALEKCRINAMNAKMNRDRKKKEREEMAREVAKLRTENTRLRRAEAAAERRAGEAERELQRLRALLSQSEVGAAAVEVAKACKKKHATERARLACDTCSLGNKRGRQGMKAR